LRADDPVSGQAVVRLEVDYVRLGDRAEHAVGSRAGFLLDHRHVVTFDEGWRQAQVVVEPGRVPRWTRLPLAHCSGTFTSNRANPPGGVCDRLYVRRPKDRDLIHAQGGHAGSVLDLFW
jgi:hypothetical protein